MKPDDTTKAAWWTSPHSNEIETLAAMRSSDAEDDEEFNAEGASSPDVPPCVEAEEQDDAATGSADVETATADGGANEHAGERTASGDAAHGFDARADDRDDDTRADDRDDDAARLDEDEAKSNDGGSDDGDDATDHRFPRRSSTQPAVGGNGEGPSGDDDDDLSDGDDAECSCLNQ